MQFIEKHLPKLKKQDTVIKQVKSFDVCLLLFKIFEELFKGMK